MKTKVARNTSGSIRTDSLILKLVRLDGVVRMVCGMALQKDRTVDMVTGQPKKQLVA
jgi:hypothetical protein